MLKFLQILEKLLKISILGGILFGILYVLRSCGVI